MTITHMSANSQNTEQKVSLSLGDLQAVLNLIDLSSSRGSFRANELEDVGRLYNHLSLFIKQTKDTLEGESNKENDNVGSSNTSQEESTNNVTESNNAGASDASHTESSNDNEVHSEEPPTNEN